MNYSIGLRLFIVSNQYIIQRQIEIKSTLFVCTCYVSYFLKSKGVRIENETRYTRKSIHMETGSKCIKNVIWFASDKLLSINFNGAKYSCFFWFCFCSAYYRSSFVYPSIKYWVLKDTNSTQHYIYEQYVSKCKGETSLVLLILFLQTFRARWQQWLYSVGENQWDALMSIYRPRL